MPEPTFRGEDVALFIDWENFKISLAVGNRTPNLSSLKEEISEFGRVVVSKAYADWVTKAPELRGASQFINDPPSLYAAGIEPVFVPTRSPSSHAAFANGVRTARIKNSVDVKMTADCIECAHSYPNIGTFVLVSGDSDFIHVVNALRTMGKRVVVVGVSWSTSRRLADQVDSLILYDIDVEPLRPAVVEVAQAPAEAPNSGLDRNDLPEVIRAIEEIIRDERAAGGNPLLTSIKQRLTRRYPNFDEKKLGFSGFKKLMGRAAADGNIKLITAGLVDWAIMADEETPEGAAEASPQTTASTGSRPSRRRGGRRRGPAREDEAEPTAESADTAGGDSEDEEEAADQPEVVAVIGPAEEPETQTPEEPQPVFGGDEELTRELEEALAFLFLPPQPEDGRASERISDLVVMADTLEHREGMGHVAFNFLVSEICDALQQGLEAEAIEITYRWGESNSRNFVSRMLRGLDDGGFFQKGNHSWRDEETGQTRRRRTFNLNRENPLVDRMLVARLGPPEDPPEDPPTNGHEPEGEVPFEDGLTAENGVPPGYALSSDTAFLQEDPKGLDESGTQEGPDGDDESGTQEGPDGHDESDSQAGIVDPSFISRLFRPLRS